MEQLEDLFREYKKLTEEKAPTKEPTKEERKKIIFDKVIYIIGPNNWEVVPCDEQGNILHPSKTHELGYQIVFIFPPGLPEKIRISISEIEKYQEKLKEITISWIIKIVELIYTAKSRNISKEIVFCLYEPQLDIFKLAWNTLIEFKDKNLENPEELLYKSLGILFVNGLEKNSKVYIVVGTNKNGGPKYYLNDGILLYSDGNFERL